MINNRFVLKKKLGEGRSRVFLCMDKDNPEKDYAIKILPASVEENEIKTFRNEFFTLQKLNHPNIITSHEEGVVVKNDEDDEIKIGSRFIILDYFPGVELLKYNKLNDEGALKIILTQVCSVLYYLHQSNYIYYDLKPENILVNQSKSKPVIKLIDMGFAHHSSLTDEYLSRGTAEYIAPEILKKESHNHKVDLYSLGIMLYRIVYGKFPFSSESDLDIYKEQIEREFEFPESNYSPVFIDVIKKLVEKDPVNRYENTLQTLTDLDIEIGKDVVKDFVPVNVFADREDVIVKTDNYLRDDNTRDVLVITGVEGSGKTSFMYNVYSTYEKVVLINDTGRRKGINFIQYLLKKIIYSEFIYSFLSKDVLVNVEKMLFSKTDDLVAGLKAVLTKISLDSKFIVIIDDFNLLDEFVLDICREILPILQVNGTKIILTERSDHPVLTSEIINRVQGINLSPFSNENLNEYFDKAFVTFFPKDQLKELVTGYSDLLPGSIINFVRDLILLNIVRFYPDAPEITSDETTKGLLESSHEEIFKLRFSLLTPEEIEIAQFLSSFENLPEVSAIAQLNNLPIGEFYNIAKKLEEKNILQVSHIENALSFTSDSLKKYVYSTIDHKEEYHTKIANAVSEKLKIFNRRELARQYELGKDFVSSYKILSEEIDEADRLSVYSYKKNLIDHLLKLPLSEDYKLELNYKLSLTLYKLNDAKAALNVIESLLTNAIDKKVENELLILKGSCLIELGEFEEGKALLNNLVKDVIDEIRKQKLMVEIAYAEFDLGRYDIAKNICNEIINKVDTLPEEKGKCYNLLGLLDTYKDNNLDGALNNFESGLEMYHAANLMLNEAKIEVNIGNTYNRKEDYRNAEKHWNGALQRNRSIGNLDQEAKILLNFGIFYYNESNFDKAIIQYKRVYDIFTSLGNRNGQGLVLSNLGETYLTSCEYQNAFESLNKAKDIFSQLLNVEEEAEVSFMLCKLFFILGHEERLNLTMNYLKSLIEKKSLPKRYDDNYKFLDLVNSIQKRNKEINSNVLKEGMELFKEQNDGGFFAEGYIILCETLIQNTWYKDARDMLNDEKLSKISEQNFLYKAKIKYLQSLLAIQNNSFNLPSPIGSLEDAHNMIKDEHITELTWKVLYALGEYYFNRGNLKKASGYLLYSKEVMKFIADNIRDDNLRIKYLSKLERKSVLEKIETMGG